MNCIYIFFLFVIILSIYIYIYIKRERDIYISIYIYSGFSGWVVFTKETVYSHMYIFYCRTPEAKLWLPTISFQKP